MFFFNKLFLTSVHQNDKKKYIKNLILRKKNQDLCKQWLLKPK